MTDDLGTNNEMDSGRRQDGLDGTDGQRTNDADDVSDDRTD